MTIAAKSRSRRGKGLSPTWQARGRTFDTVSVTAIVLSAREAYRSGMTKGEDYHRRALAADAHAEQSLGITRAHFIESARAWREKALEAGYIPAAGEKGRSGPRG
jgi:hypothetical protein